MRKVCVRNNFATEHSIQPIRPRKEVWSRFHQKIPTKNVFLRMEQTSLQDTCPQSCHLVRLAKKIGEVRFSTKIQTENVFFGKTNLRGLLRQNSAMFSSETILPPNAPYSQFRPEKRYGAGFVKKSRLKTCFLGRTKLRTGTLLPHIAPSSPFGP